jgi:hypothetical protein
MKHYLLIAGYQYYPSRGTGDWVGCYEYESEAIEKWNEISKFYDWYDIVDLREWMNR